MTAADWHPNRGEPPVFEPDYPGEACPPNLIHCEEAGRSKVFVRLRNGAEPRESWPVFGRPIPTRWSLLGNGFDIRFWRRA